MDRRRFLVGGSFFFATPFAQVYDGDDDKKTDRDTQKDDHSDYPRYFLLRLIPNTGIMVFHVSDIHLHIRHAHHIIFVAATPLQSAVYVTAILSVCTSHT